LLLLLLLLLLPVGMLDENRIAGVPT